MKKRQRRYWYRFYVGECPICGRDQGWKERVYGRKPKDPRKRYVQVPQYACDHHFL